VVPLIEARAPVDVARDGFGAVFPAVHASLLSRQTKPKRPWRASASVSAFGVAMIAARGRNERVVVEAPGIEPGSENTLLLPLRA
jgi:hypothetical protein